MQRHDRRVPVSFFSRYTRDIAKFADEHCRGRVVSVLEGGYSDRALTSAAMGHVVGMLGQEGKGEWWDPKSLDDVGHSSLSPRRLRVMLIN
jgi:histone deacetylase HOS3